ncbi:MAG: NAD-dependent epimerase/dehydratase family protein [Marmoricola sp.]
MRLLVLGGTHHVGRAVVETALARGDEVTTLNRGTSGVETAGVDRRLADRRDPAELAAALGPDSWDAVIDTWSQEPVVVRETARLLWGRAAHYGYVSSRSVHTWPMQEGADECAPVVEASAGSHDASDYSAAKRGGELAAAEFGAEVLLARAGLVLGPFELVGRLPWWLRRMAAGGPVPAPGPPDRPLQYVDARDLAAWMLRCADAGTAGAFNVVSERGHATIGSLLEACRQVTGGGATLAWRSPEAVAACGVEGWTQLPIWTPPTGELAALHDGDVSAALAAGLVCRPVEETVADTWAWLRAEGYPEPVSDRAGRLGTTADQEACLLAAG